MPEPTSTAVATVAVATATVPALTAFGVPLGLRPELLIAGFAGALVAIVLLNAVPSTGDTWRELLRTTSRRISAAVASSLTAGYLTPMLAAGVTISEPVLLGLAFAAGAGAQQLVRAAIARLGAKVAAGEGAP
jgi:hypothetical protein